ncbi:MAG TPA: hypothetical protein DHV05_02625 [Acholeplasmataceae bacterium]|nr:hypothetical protein [Acholeplasmataceae bacterium]
MNAINYYMFVGGENYEEIGLISRRHDWQSAIGTDGTLRRHYHIIKHIVKVSQAYGKAFVKATLNTQTTLAFDVDYYMTEFKNDFNRGQANTLQHMRQTYLYNGIGKSLVMNNISFDAVDLIGDEVDVKTHPTLIAFSTEWMREDAQQKLVNYIKQGGKLFLFPELPTKDLLDRPCTILKDYIGVQIKEKLYGKRVNINGHDSVNCHVAQVYDVKDGFATLDLDHNKITGFKKDIDLGRVYMFGMAIKSDWDYIDHIMNEIFRDMGLASSGQSDEWLHVAIRSGEDGHFIFINNFEEFDKTSKIISLNKDMFEGFTFTIPMRKGIILPYQWKVTPDFMIRYSTAEVTHVEKTEHQIKLTFKPLQRGDIILYEGDYRVLKQDGITIIGPKKIQLLTSDEVTITWQT